MSGLKPAKKGEVRNPKGYSRSRRVTDGLVALIEKMGADEAISKMWLKQMLAGEFRFFKEYLDRVEGPARDEGVEEGHPLVEALREIAGGRKGKPKRPKKGR